jgi:hypothetical protein
MTYYLPVISSNALRISFLTPLYSREGPLQTWGTKDEQ